MSIGFLVLKTIIHENLPFSDLTEYGIDENYFEGGEKKAYNFIKNFKYAHNKYPNLSTIQAEIGQKIDFDNLKPEPLDYLVPQIRERKQHWICNEALSSISDALQNNATKKAVDTLKEYVEVLNSTEEGFSLKNLQDIQKEVIDQHNEVQLNPGISGIPFGFPSLDELTYGQQSGDFNVIVGVTGACKSYVCLQSALSAYLKGYNVMIISPEMPERQIGRRVLSLQTRLKEKDFRKGNLSYYAIQKARETIDSPVTVNNEEKNNWFKILPSGLYSDVNSLTAIAREYSPDLLCVDGFYLLKDKKSKSGSTWAEAESVIMTLKNFAIYSKIPVLATTQYNRSKPGQLEGARSSQSVEQISSNFFSLDFENKEDRNTMKPVQYRLLSTKKSRDGDSMIIKLKLNFNKMTISEYSVISGKSGLEEQEPEFEDPDFMVDL